MAVAAAFHGFLDDRHIGSHAVDDAIEVNAEHPLPILVRSLVDGSASADAGVVADHVDTAEIVPNAACAPAPASARVMPRPMPEAAPVTTATLF